jgi:hypothetical protein
VSADQTHPTHMSIAAPIALSLGLLALALCWVPLLGVLALPFGISAIVVGSMAIRRIRSRGSSGFTLALTGLVTGAIGLTVAASLFAVFLRGFRGPAWQGDWADVRELFQPAPR